MVDRRRTPNMWEYFKHPERYPAMHQTYGTPMPRPPVDRLAGRWDQGPQPQYNLGPSPAPSSFVDPPAMLGPGGITDNSAWQAPLPRHRSLGEVVASPVPTAVDDPAQDASVAMGMELPPLAVPGREPIQQRNDAPALMGAFGQLGPRIAAARAANGNRATAYVQHQRQMDQSPISLLAQLVFGAGRR